MEFLTGIWTALTGAQTTAIIIIVLMVITRFLPDEKLLKWGFKAGRALSFVGTRRLGKAWEKIESFVIHSFGSLYTGFVKGLQSDNDEK
jgi:hypothetical protein